MPTIRLTNPHSVLAALETRPSEVLEVAVPSGSSEAWNRVLTVARQKGVRAQTAPARERASGRGPKGLEDRGGAGRASGAEATVQERAPVTVEELFADAGDRAGGKGLWLALDSLQDPQNVGAIFRAAAFFGVQGILMTAERSAPMTATVYDVASGGVEYVPFSSGLNLQRAFELAKEADLWILGATEHQGDELASIQRDRPWLLVLGNEEKGMRRLTEESCDLLCRIPARGQVTSLNVSVAAGILISHFCG